ncbi:MAG TPA: PA2778 family cysteine peptidase [Bacteriovoracaceae bacterium]|nr:PA2778 family cysteine peptidase [Bacteriovoracaceae bacterium]
MYALSLIMVALLSMSCATKTLQTDALVKDHSNLSEKVNLQNVPFIKQETNHCGPATMTMVLQHLGSKASLDELTSQVFTEGMQGTFQAEMISSSRRQGMLALQINDLESMLKEIEAGHPVIVFQNLGFSFLPKWHYAVAVGYNLSGPDIILHSGDKKFEKGDLRFFERTWKLGGNWGLLVLRPDQLSATASDTSHAAAAATLEQMGKSEEARISYKTILSKWPQSLSALIGMGNISYAKKELKASIGFLKHATKHHPLSATAWHNLATVQGELGLKEDARKSSLKAIELVDEEKKASFRQSLNSWL